MIDMSELMFDVDFIQPYQVPVLRFTGSYDGNGLYRPNVPEWLELTMVIQQSTFKQLQALPEGERNGDFINWWSHFQVILADGVSDQQSDVIMWREKHYRVIRCSDRSDNGFWEGIAQSAPLTAGLWEVIPETGLFTISGTIRPGMAGIQINLQGTKTATAYTNASGNYSFANLAAGVYAVTPVLKGYDFTPRTIVVTVGEPPEPGIGVYDITGTVRRMARIPRIVGVRIDLEGTETGHTFTDAHGDYSFINLSEGIYVITPTLEGYDFNPRNIVLTLPLWQPM